jgi:hypothetical protein
MSTQARSNATRIVPWLAPNYWLAFSVLVIGAAVAALQPAEAQEEPAGLATDEELHEIVGPIALYPDDLVAIVLPASTYPLQVVQAARFLEDQEKDSSVKPDEEWDDSVVALLNYPEVVKLMNDDLDWTYDLGTAVLNQRADVLDAIQGFRDEAYAAGNLRSDERQTVAVEDDTIEIKPADPEVIYVPYYEPERVVVYQPTPVYYYYPRPYPVYYYPYPAHYSFHTGFFWGVSTWFSIGWHSHYVHVYDPFYYGHPYYGWTYYNPFYVRNVYVNVNHYYSNNVWEPRYRYGGRPGVSGSEGRVYTADRRPRHGALDQTTRTTEGRSYRPREATPPTAEPTQASNTPRGRSTFAREPLGRSTQTSEASRGRGTLAQEPMGNARTRESAASTDSSRTQPGQGTARSGGGMSQARGPSQTEPRGHSQAQPRGQAQAQARQPSTPSATASQSYRSNGGGMSQAMGRSRAATQPSGDARTSPGSAGTNPGASPRAYQPSTGAPREASRATPAPRASVPAPRQPSHGGGMGAQRSESGSGYRGNSGGNAGGGYSNGGHSGGGHAGAGNSGGGHSGGGSSGGGGSYRGGGSARTAQR